MTEKTEERIVRSEEVQEILSAPPRKLVSIGSSVIGGIIMAIFVGCFFFKYPDTINCTVIITKAEPPVWIVAKTSGRIQELYAVDGQQISKGDIIAVIENTANTTDVIYLDSLLCTTPLYTDSCIDLMLSDLYLGDVQSAYATLAKAVTDYNNFVSSNLYDQRIASEQAQLKPYEDYMESVLRQVGYSKRINSLSQKDYQREKTLFDKGLTSASSLEETEESMLGRSMSAEQMLSSLANARIQVAQIRNTITELQMQREQEGQKLKTSLLTAWEGAKSAIKGWRQDYLLESPVKGVVSYNNHWKVNQNVSAGDKVFAVVSSPSDDVVGKARIPIVGSGKVVPGQRMNITLDGYPYLEYGFLTGKVLSVASMPDDNTYAADFELVGDGLTSYGYQVYQEGDMTGTAEIITDNLSVAERIVAPLRYLLHRNI